MEKKNKVKIVILVVIAIILIAFIIITARKMIIISKLDNKAKEIEKVGNFHTISYTYGNGEYTKSEVFKSGDKIKTASISVDNDNNVTKLTFVGNKADNSENTEYTGHNYMETSDYKITSQDEKVYGEITIRCIKNPFKTENFWELLGKSVKSTIKSETYNGKDCYYITNLEEYALHVEKETGLPIGAERLENNDIQVLYEIDTVTEEDFKEPDINEYEVVDNYTEFFKNNGK